MDKIILAEIPLLVWVGVTEEERGSEQEIVIDVELWLDLAAAGADDDLSKAVNYEAVCETVEAVARSRPFRLIEAIAEESARAVLEQFAVAEVQVRVRKPGALQTRGVPYAAVEIRRRRGG